MKYGKIPMKEFELIHKPKWFVIRLELNKGYTENNF